MKFIAEDGFRFVGASGKRKSFGIYECPSCGLNVSVLNASVKSGNTTKCKKCAALKHGDSTTKFYRRWNSMMSRCYKKYHKSYKDYGGKGITVCEEWHVYENFKEWALDNGYEDSLSIDRIDSSLGYKPSNCRFATKTVQSRNTRKIISTNTSGYRGVSYIATAKKYSARISISNINKFLGYYELAIDAARVYDKYVIENKLEHTINGV